MTLRRRSRTRPAIALAITATALALAGCGGPSGSSNTLKIGFMGDLTGPSSGIVVGPRNAAKMVVDAYNATNPPRPVELVEYDSQGSPDQAVPLATKAVSDGVVALIGPAFSGESKAADPVLEQGKVPNVSPVATNPKLSANGWRYFHRVIASDAAQGPAIADFLVTAKRPARAFVVNDDQEYSVGIADAVAQRLTAKGVSVSRDQFAEAASDHSSTVVKVQAANPDVIFFGGYYGQGGRLLKQLRDGGVTALFATGDGSLDAGLIDGAGPKAAEGAVVGCPCTLPSGKLPAGRLADFVQAYRSRYQTDPPTYATEGYDAATALVEAIKAGATTREAINDSLAKADFAGVAKRIKFQPNGDVVSTDIFVHQVQGGRFALLGEARKARLGSAGVRR
jgi:branched-chain amino acid transport system substrate-binding protein